MRHAVPVCKAEVKSFQIGSSPKEMSVEARTQPSSANQQKHQQPQNASRRNHAHDDSKNYPDDKYGKRFSAVSCTYSFLESIALVFVYVSGGPQIPIHLTICPGQVLLGRLKITYSKYYKYLLGTWRVTLHRDNAADRNQFFYSVTTPLLLQTRLPLNSSVSIWT